MMKTAFLIFIAAMFAWACDVPETTEQQPIRTPDGCYISGCSGQLCANEPRASTCEWNDSYACYQDATCARQDDGECGWIMSEELEACLVEADVSRGEGTVR